VEDICAGGAAELNAGSILTCRGGRWHVSTVMNVLKRMNRTAGQPTLD
jgi:hypothetical protein